MLKKVLFIFIFFLISLTAFAKDNTSYIKSYIYNVEHLNQKKIDYITDITFKCYYYYRRKIKSLEDDILKSAKQNEDKKFPILPDDGYSYCPKVIINVSTSPLEPEGIFRKGVIIINYNPLEMCEEKIVLGVYKRKICKKPNFDHTLMHELVHFAFYKIYGNIKFRKIIFNKYENCLKTKCPNLSLLNLIVSYRNFYDEFPATFFSNIWNKVKNCKNKVDNKDAIEYFVKTTLFFSKQDFLNCRLENRCGVYYLYRQLKDISNSFNLCVNPKIAFKILLNVSIENEKKDFLPLIKSDIFTNGKM